MSDSPPNADGFARALVDACQNMQDCTYTLNREFDSYLHAAQTVFAMQNARITAQQAVITKSQKTEELDKIVHRELHDRNDALMEELEAAKKTIEEKNKLLEAAECTIAEQTERLASQDKVIYGLTKQLNESKTELSDWQTTLDNYRNVSDAEISQVLADPELDELKAAHAALSAEVKTLKKKDKKSQDAMEKQRLQLAAQEAKVAALKVEGAQKDKAHKDSMDRLRRERDDMADKTADRLKKAEAQVKEHIDSLVKEEVERRRKEWTANAALKMNEKFDLYEDEIRSLQEKTTSQEKEIKSLRTLLEGRHTADDLDETI